MEKTRHIHDDISIVLCGGAGQGIQTIEYLLTRILKLTGYNLFATKEYMSRIRGGSNSTEIRISSKKVSAYVDRIDLLIPLDKNAIPHLAKRISKETVILGEKERLGTEYEIIDIPFSNIASDIGGIIYANVVAVGVVAGLLEVAHEHLDSYLKNYFSAKDEEIIQNNIEAEKRGYDIGHNLSCSGNITIDIQKDTRVKGEILLNGAEAVALGAIAGGCNFIASYPMSPSTGVLVFLAQHSEEFGIIVEQAEDEIAAVNMGLGAWYAGARAIVSTSGGGFALMAEGISLAGMLETPIVIHLAQRPGPATGLPTRTEQGDLELALYAGHGEFPRIVFSPGTIREMFYLTQKAFNIADKYQTPVVILTDQFLIDSYYNIASLDLSNIQVERYIVKTNKGYKRYRLTEDGISPRGIPGFGEGIVSVDSDEHDEKGHITEDLDLRIKMVDKRLKKSELISREITPPELVGNEDYRTLIIGWGSTYNVIKEALERLDRDDISFLHFKQVYPLHPATSDYIKRAKETVIVENNATSQFGKLIRLQTGIDIENRVLKYNGLPFSVEELLESFNDIG